MSTKSSTTNECPNVLRSVKAIMEAERIERRKSVKRMISKDKISDGLPVKQKASTQVD